MRLIATETIAPEEGAAAPPPLVGREALRQWLGLPGATDDPLVERLYMAAISAVESYTQRAIQPRRLRWTFAGQGSVPAWPLAPVTSVFAYETRAAVSDDWATTSTDDYLVTTHGVALLSSSSWYPSPYGFTRVTADVGYDVDDSDRDAYALAVMRHVATAYAIREGEVVGTVRAAMDTDWRAAVAHLRRVFA